MEAGRKFYLPESVQLLRNDFISEWAQRVKEDSGLIKKL
jgi:hypothetical protein